MMCYEKNWYKKKNRNNISSYEASKRAVSDSVSVED